jgi:hypothetical protein
VLCIGVGVEGSENAQLVTPSRIQLLCIVTHKTTARMASVLPALEETVTPALQAPTEAAGDAVATSSPPEVPSTESEPSSSAAWKHQLLAPLLMLAGNEAKREYLEQQLTVTDGMEAAARSFVDACSTTMLKHLLLTFRTEPTLLWINFPTAAHLAAIVESQKPVQEGEESRHIEMQLTFKSGGSVVQVTRAEFMNEMPAEVMGEAALKRLNHAFNTVNRRTHFVAFGTCPLDEQTVAFGVQLWPLEMIHEVVRAGTRDEAALATFATLPVEAISAAEKRRRRAKRAKQAKQAGHRAPH